MRKIFFIVTMLFYIVALASDQPIKIVNNTNKMVRFQLITRSIDQSGYPFLYSIGPVQDLIELPPNTTIIYNDPNTPGIPFSLIGSWYLQTSTSTTVISGTYASVEYATKQKWWKFKFLIVDSESPEHLCSGNVGPGGDGLIWTGSADCPYTVTWDGEAIIIS